MSKEKSNGVESTPIEQSEKGAVQVTGEVVEERKARNSPKTSKETWRKIRVEFEAGTYVSLKDLAGKHGVPYHVMRKKIYRDKWNEQQRTLEYKVSQKVEQKVLKQVDIQTSYLARLNARSEKYERMLDASADNLGGKTEDGTPLVDPDMLDTLSRSEIRVMEMRKTALKIVNQVDVLSNGQGLGDSFIMAIAKLRSSESPKLGNEDLSKVLEAEIE